MFAAADVICLAGRRPECRLVIRLWYSVPQHQIPLSFSSTAGLEVLVSHVSFFTASKIRDNNPHPLKMASQVPHSAQVEQTRTGFQRLPVEIRLEIHRLILPTKTVVDIMEKPTFYGHSYWYDFFTMPLMHPDDDFYSEEEDENDYLDSVGEAANAQAEQQGGGVNEESQHGGNTDSNDNNSGRSRTSIQKPQGDPVDDWAREPFFNSVGERDQQKQTIKGLLLTSRSVREEVLDVLYGENLFCIDMFAKSHFLTSHLGLEKMGRVRHLMMLLFPRDEDEIILHTRVFKRIIPNLRSLRIVAEQPFLDRQLEEHHEECYQVRSRETWTVAFQRILGLVETKLPVPATLIADVGGGQRNSVFSLLDGLSHPYQRLRTKIGDRMFRRYDGDKWRGDEDEDWQHCFGCYLATEEIRSRLRGLHTH
ncbi:hypothetical protein GE09DRAFT_546292 [Coniochaeta sp. 2T2.1]|nr:hypothetical protein GE09DRAFT_546292 [Coniochaeta sp. 2T2.1]